jgi:hypothetical protein
VTAGGKLDISAVDPSLPPDTRSIYDPVPLLVQEFFTHFTLPAAESDPPLPVAVSVTVRFPFAVKSCVAVAPLPVPPSPKFHAYDVAFVDPPPLNVHLRDEHV